MTNQQLIKRAWKWYGREWRVLVAVTFVSTVLNGLLGLLPDALNASRLRWVTMVLMQPMTLGINAVYLAVVQKKQVTVAQMFDFYRMQDRYWPIFLLTAPTWAGTAGMALLTALMGLAAANPVLVLALFAVMIAGLVLYSWFVLRWSVVTAAWVLNPQLTAKEAFHKGWPAGKGSVGRLLGLMCVLLLIPVVAVALLYVMTWGQVGWTNQVQKALLNVPLYILLGAIVPLFRLGMAGLHWELLRNIKD